MRALSATSAAVFLLLAGSISPDAPLVTAPAQGAQTPPPASEALFKRMLLERPEYASSPGRKNTLTIDEFHIAKPVRWTMEYGENPAQDKNTLVYKVRARYTVQSENINTVTGQRYPATSREYRRHFNYYVNRSGRWIAEMGPTTSDWK
jgi:hypothetical protein